MNPRILELQHQAMSLVLNGNDPDGDVEKMYIPAEFTKKLAELIVRECATICKDVGNAVWAEPHQSNMGTAQTCKAAIEKHFGVEE
jgi:hypothetical protein